ncbi:MAG: hypothetical protein EOO20_22710 [Chryseobacterium sp.]|nr:MAG: hypothetical protein EOO20_22710 [Chryseobacterium sp.]
MAQSNLFEQIRIKNLLDGWQKFTIQKWQEQLRKKGIGVTDTLYNSFEKAVRAQSGEKVESIMKFLMYGRFRDMNVGRGLKAYERGTNNYARNAERRYGVRSPHVDRVQKRWLNKVNAAQTYRLSEIIGIRGAQSLITSFNQANNL